MRIEKGFECEQTSSQKCLLFNQLSLQCCFVATNWSNNFGPYLGNFRLIRVESRCGKETNFVLDRLEEEHQRRQIITGGEHVSHGNATPGMMEQ